MQVLGHLLYPEDGCQPGAETLCKKKTGQFHITQCSFIPAPSFKGFRDQAGVFAPPYTWLGAGTGHKHPDVQSHR